MRILELFKKRRNTIASQAAKQELASPSLSTKPAGKASAQEVTVDTDTADSLRKIFIAFDVETTGLNPSQDRIVELGAVFFEEGEPRKRFQTLVNPGVQIDDAVSAINNITNDMLKAAPKEVDVYRNFLEFLGSAAKGYPILCAHNASFDISFLTNTLSRLEFNAQLKYVDTLFLSKRVVEGLDNYKQNTLCSHFGIHNAVAHRAASDAEVCGRILCALLANKGPALNGEGKNWIRAPLSPEELKVCAFLQHLLDERNIETEPLRFHKDSAGYVVMSNLYQVLKFKFAKKGNYIILPRDGLASVDLPLEDCSQSEGGTSLVRVYFVNARELAPFSKQIASLYSTCRDSMESYLGLSEHTRREVERIINERQSLSQTEIQELLLLISKETTGHPVPALIKQRPSRNDVIVKAIHNRCPLEEVRNLGNWKKGYDEGSQHYYKGEKLRKEGLLKEALILFDKARYHGYEAPALYDSYAKTYRQLKDYANEVVIIEEFLSRQTYNKDGIFRARRDKAIALLHAEQKARHGKNGGLRASIDS